MTTRRRILVTGATGFIGSRLVHSLDAHGWFVRGLSRRHSVKRTSEGAVEMLRGDVTNPASLEMAVRGCDVVVHCAWGGADIEEARRVNVQGTVNLLSAARRAGVRRVVHLSSVAVHGFSLPAQVTEALPLQLVGDPYIVTKAEGELRATEYARLGDLEVVILRPTLVYGPGSATWLMRYVERVRSEKIVLIDDGKGLANLVYVDDLVDAIEAAVEQPGVNGEAFLISGSEPVTWRRYLEAIARMCGKPCPRAVGQWRVGCIVVEKLYSALTERRRRVQDVDLLLMRQRAAVSIDKAARQLGYSPRTGFEEGMRRCAAWLYANGIVAGPRA